MTPIVETLLIFSSQAIGILVFMFSLTWKLTVITLVSIPAMTVISKWFGDLYRHMSELSQKKLADANASAVEALSSMTTVRAFSSERSEVDRYAFSLEEYMVIYARKTAAYGFYAFATTILPQLVTSLTLFYGGKLVLSGEMSGGDLVSFMLYQMSLASAFNSIADVFSGIMEALGAADKVFNLMGRRPRIPLGGDYVPASGTFRGEITLQNVCFSYPARPDMVVLKNLSLDVHPGEVVALVGASGGGKSSIIKLMEGFYEPSSGSVMLDGVPLLHYRASWLKRHIAIV